MTSPLDSPPAVTLLDLPGLEPDNLLAFLALLGLLRALETARPAWSPRVSWHGPPWVARLHLANPVGEVDMTSAVEEGMCIARHALAPHSVVSTMNRKKGKLETKGRKSLFSTAYRAKRLKQLAIKAAFLSHQEIQGRRRDLREAAAILRLDILSSLAIENNIDNEVFDSPLKLTSGQQTFVGALYNSILRILEIDTNYNDNAIRRALFAPWLHQDIGDSLRLSPDEARRYALRFGDPTKATDKPTTELGANALASLGLASLRMAARDGRWCQVGYVGSRSSGQLTWPIFSNKNGVSIETIVCVMALPEVIAPAPNALRLAPYGVSELFRAYRFVLDPSTGDYGNISRARALWGFTNNTEPV